MERIEPVVLRFTADDAVALAADYGVSAHSQVALAPAAWYKRLGGVPWLLSALCSPTTSRSCGTWAGRQQPCTPSCTRGREGFIDIPRVRLYHDEMGRPGDAGVVAVTSDGDRLGAAWYRLFSAEEPGWGFIAADVPELVTGVAAEARGRGVGGALLDALLALAREQRHRALSLSVDRQNPARRLYERKGFRDAGISDPTDSSVTMVADL